MREAPALPVRSVRERAAAWLVTGPIGHFWSVLADLGVYGARLVGARVVSRRTRT